MAFAKNALLEKFLMQIKQHAEYVGKMKLSMVAFVKNVPLE